MKKEKIGTMLWLVTGDSGEKYYVDTDNGVCNCPAWIIRKIRPCKHLKFCGVNDG